MVVPKKEIESENYRLESCDDALVKLQLASVEKIDLVLRGD